MPAVFERAAELVQGSVGGDAELDVLKFRPIQEGDFKEARFGFDDHFVFSVGENYASHLKASGASLEGNFGTVVDGLGESAEWQVPFHRVDAGDAGKEKQVGVGKEAVARADHDAGAAHLCGQLL